IFQDKLDLRSEKEVVQECRRLNEKISSTVLTIIDEWSQFRNGSSLDQNHPTGTVKSEPDYQKHLQSVLGCKTYALVKCSISSPLSSECQDRMIDALQVYATHFAFNIISRTFCPGLPPQSRECDTLGPQATALRWRELTFTHGCQGVHKGEVLADLQSQLSFFFRTMFTLAGENNSSPFLEKMQPFIVDSTIVESALRLSKMLKTCFFSAHLDVFLIQPTQTFDSRFMTVDDSSRRADSLGTRPVLCTIELGIQEIPPAQHRNPMAKGRVLLKPKVLVEVS
ncbi:hypothetical protein DFH11DRAFT_1494974, partial [Phellopilus nigrolimitatus]